MKKIWQLLIFLGIIVIAAVIYYFVTREGGDKEAAIVKVEEGNFEMTVTAMGELEALVSKDITIPEIMQNMPWSLRVYQLPINDMVKEGTVVKRGDYVATLGAMSIEENIKRITDLMLSREVEFENAKIDSSLVLSEARDGIRRAKDVVTDREIKLEQSIYESQAVQRQAQINLEVSQRNFEQAERNYISLKRKHEIKVDRAKENLNKEIKDIELLENLKKEVIIKAPGRGLIVYQRDYSGEKIKPGSNVSRWQPFIAMLPDLTTLQSVTYVKEIDIAKIDVGMIVRLKIDAFPEKDFNGEITRIANVGQELSGQFLTGFKVEIKVDPAGETLLPGMTSTNIIIVQNLKDVLTVPRQAIFTEDDIFFVYKKDGLSTIKQEVSIGGENETHVLIEKGLQKGDKVLTQPPKSAEDLNLVSG
ncbi:MAG: efflux RND transporter periplasmic adaptor subunit [Marinilabiliaceae bacterium]|nr:efflux RND transporter periplasmic adaptor subunit [Marinilabiliaceae bacterium]